MKTRAIFVGLLVAGLGVALLALYMRKFEIDASGGPKVELLVAGVEGIPGVPLFKEANRNRHRASAPQDRSLAFASC